MTHRVWIGLLSVALAVGCSQQGADKAPANVGLLREVAELVRASTQGNRPPGKLADLERNRNMFPAAFEAVKTGGIVVLYGEGPKGEGEVAAGGGNVLAYEKDVPAAGGYVLLASGEVKKMSAAEFTAAPKAGKP